MTNTIIPLDQLGASHLPAKMRARFEQGLLNNQNFADNVRDAYPTLSIKGKVFRFRQSGSEQPHVDERGYPVPYLDVILVNASPDIAKSYYEKGYTEGDLDLPRCWSLDSVKPHASVPDKVNPVCGTCPMNQFGSRITDSGKQAKACQDQRRVAISLPHHLENANPVPVLMRVPQSSLKNLKVYAETLDRYGVDIGGVITRLSFEPMDAFPRIKFEYAGVLDDMQYDKVIDLAEDPTTVAMLSAPITEPAEENLTEEQKLRTPPQRQAAPQRPAPQGNVTPFPPQQAAPQAAAPARPAPAPQPAAQTRPAPAAAPATAKPKAVGGIVDLGGKFYNPVTQEFCNPDGSPLGSTPEPVEAQAQPEPEVQEEAPAPAPATSGPAPRQRRARGSGTAALQANPEAKGDVQAAAPALDKLLSDLLPRGQ